MKNKQQAAFDINKMKIECTISNISIYKYITYRLSGFLCPLIENDVKKLQIIEIGHAELQQLIECENMIPSMDDYVINTDHMYVNIVNYKNHIIYDKNTNTIFYHVGEQDSLIDKILGIKIIDLIHSILVCNNTFCLHSSCVEYNKTGTLFLGTSGSGKTTIALKLIEKGYKITNDDCTYITASNNSFFAIKNTQPIGLTKTGLQNTFYYLANQIVSTDDAGKYRIFLYESNPSWYVTSVKIKNLIWVSACHSDKNELCSITKLDMVQKILTNISTNRFVNYEQYIQNIIDLVMTSNTYKLTTKNDIEESSRFIDQNLQEI